MDLAAMLDSTPFYNNNKELPDPDLLMMYRGFENREIWIEDDISWETCGLYIKLIKAWNKQDAESGTAQPITVHIYCQGGDLQVMFALYDTFKASRTPIITINEGICFSAAVLVFLAGKLRKMNPHALFVIHEGSAVIGGTAKETKKAGREYEKDVLEMLSLIANATDMTVEFLQEQLDAESDMYIRYHDAINYGMIQPPNDYQ